MRQELRVTDGQMRSSEAQCVGREAESLDESEQGYMLLGLIVAIAIMMLWLGVAASEAARSLRREREVESARRANQYVRAIRKFYLKSQRYPGAIEQLENTNRVRYLRQRYVDPLTGKADYRLIPVGKNQTTVKGFFGQPLAGIATTGLGAAAGMQSSGIAGPTTAGGIGGAAGAGYAAGAAGATGTGASTGAGAGATGTGGTGTGGTGTGATGTGATGTGGTGDASGSTQGFGNTLGSAQGMSSGLPGSTGPFMGVGSSASGESILVVNEQTTYQTWEFLYDPRIEKLKATAAMSAGAGSVGASSLGTGSTTGTTPTTPTTTGLGGTSTPPAVTPPTGP